MRARGQSGVRPEVSDFAKAASTAGLMLKSGIGAIKGEYRAGVELKPGYRYTGSLDLDDAFLAAEPNATRWDYGVGVRHESGDEFLVWLEAHPASSTGEVKKMLDKLAWLKRKLDQSAFEGLHRLHAASAYRWLAKTGAIRILPHSREARELSKAGLSLPQRRVDLP